MFFKSKNGNKQQGYSKIKILVPDIAILFKNGMYYHAEILSDGTCLAHGVVLKPGDYEVVK